LVDAHHQVGLYAGRILNGEKAADLQVQQVTKVALAINLKDAKARCLTTPLPLLEAEGHHSREVCFQSQSGPMARPC
jgi:hypothetical protein